MALFLVSSPMPLMSHVQGPHSRVFVLIVEDEPSISFALTEFFEARGWTVECAADPETGRRLLMTTAYDVVITDLHLTPRRQADGMELLRLVGNVSPKTITVMLTAYASAGVEAQARGLGVNRFLIKPVDLVALATDIESLAEVSRRD
jgi:DNA-binding response OmpR family regulator